MEILRALPPKLRSRWQLATASFLTIAVGALIFISIAQRLSPSAGRIDSVPTLDLGTQRLRPDRSKVGQVTSSLTAGEHPKETGEAERISMSPEHPAELHQYDTRKGLIQKLEIDNHRRDSLEVDQKRVSHEFESTKQDGPDEPQAPGAVSADQDIRSQLIAAFIRLRNLEKHYTGDSSEIVFARKEISRLQPLVARTSTLLPPVMKRQPKHIPNYQAQLIQINAEIALCDNEITSDLQKLTQLTSPIHPSAAPNVPDTPEATPATQERLLSGPLNRTDVGSKSLENMSTSSGNQRSRLSTGQTIALSTALGLLFSIFFVILSDRFDRSIRNEAQLRKILPNTAEYIGSIPRMKNS